MAVSWGVCVNVEVAELVELMELGDGVWRGMPRAEAKAWESSEGPFWYFGRWAVPWPFISSAPVPSAGFGLLGGSAVVGRGSGAGVAFCCCSDA